MNAEQMTHYEAIKAALHRYTLRNNAGFGRLGEKDAKVGAYKQHIPSVTKTAKYRVPDILSDAYLIEVKNVKYQRFSNQIKDFLAFCRETNRCLVIFIRKDTRVSVEIEELIAGGEITIQYLSNYMSEAGQEIIRKVLAPVVGKMLLKVTCETMQTIDKDCCPTRYPIEHFAASFGVENKQI
jgi:hypothetical protein